MALHCVHCDHTFEPEGSGRPRCPKCMRARDLQEVESASAGAPPPEGQPATRQAALRVVGLLVAVLVATGGYVALRGGEQDPEDDASGVADREDLAAQLEQRGVEEGALRWVEPTPAVEAFAKQAVEGVEGDEARLEALVAAIRARAQAAAFVPWSLGETQARRALPPEAVLEVLAEEGGRAQLYPLEVAALGAAAARALDLPVQVVELLSWPDEKAPLDPSGVLGYYALAQGERIWDVFRGRGVPNQLETRRLDTLEQMGAGLGLEAVALATAEGDVQRATRLAEQALKLAPESPTVRCDRAAVWAASGALDQALQEFEAAAQLRRDAPRQYHLASVAVVTGDAARAQGWLNKLVSEYPEYALPRVALAALEMAQGRVDEASGQLDLAEQAAPDLSAVRWARAELRASQGDRLAARSLAAGAFEARKTPDAYLRYAQFQSKTGDLDGAARTVVAALEAAPPGRREALREHLSALVGPAVMLDVETILEGEGEDEPPASDLQLPRPSLLGDGPAAGAELPLGEPGDGPLLMMGDTSKLRLRDERKGGLQLELPR